MLFAQTLTPELLWTMTLENYKKAKTTTDKIRCLEYLIEAGERIEDPNKETMRQRLGEKLQALKDGTTAQQVEPAFH